MTITASTAITSILVICGDTMFLCIRRQVIIVGAQSLFSSVGSLAALANHSFKNVGQKGSSSLRLDE
jgi:hypothetical protein